MSEYIIDACAWQELCNGIACRECSMLDGNACRIGEYIKKQPIYVEAELDTTEDFAEWIDVNGDGSIMKCSKCGDKVCCENNNYCPNCGRRMKKEGGANNEM